YARSAGLAIVLGGLHVRRGREARLVHIERTTRFANFLYRSAVAAWGRPDDERRLSTAGSAGVGRNVEYRIRCDKRGDDDVFRRLRRWVRRAYTEEASASEANHAEASPKTSVYTASALYRHVHPDHHHGRSWSCRRAIRQIHDRREGRHLER